MQIFGQYLQVMLAKYAEQPAVHWRNKDAAMYLVTSLVSRGSTQKHGVTQTSQLVSLPQFCQQQVLVELERPDGMCYYFFLHKTNFYYVFVVNEQPVLKADAIKYIMTFRSVLPRDMVVGTLPQLIRHLTSESAVVHTYAACTIDKILIMRDNLHQPM